MEHLRITSTLAAILIGLSACSGGGDSGSEDDTGSSETSPISDITPAKEAVDVDRDAAISVTFSEDVYNQSVGPSSFTLSADAMVSGQVSFDATDNRITLTPDETLDMLTNHTATVTTGVTDLTGEPVLDSVYSWSFQTADGAWQSSLDIDDSSGLSSGAPSLAVNHEGRAVVAWHQRSAGETDYSAYRSLYKPSQGQWTQATLLEEDSGNAQSTSAAINNNGDAVVTWNQHDGTEYQIRVNYYSAASDSWSGAQTLDAGFGAPAVAIDANGRAMVTWKQSGLQSIVYEPDTGWGSVKEIDATTNMGSPGIAVDGQGEFSVVWSLNTSGVDDIYASRWIEGSGWQSPVNIESDDAGDASSPRLSVAADGGLIAVWHQSDGSMNNAWANRYDPEADAWGNATLLETSDEGGATNVQVDHDASGNAVAVWQQFDGGLNHVWSARYRAGTGWESAEKVESDETDNAVDPRVAVDDDGNTVVLWIKDTSGFDPLMANRRVADGDWQDAVRMDSSDQTASFPSIQSIGSGEVFVAWRQSNEVLTNRLE